MHGNVGVVVAHYHPRGLVRDDLSGLVDQLAASARRVIFVSTRLEPLYAARFAGNVAVIVRENYGYDFYSYKTGIEALGDLRDLDRLIVFNSSFLCVDREKLLRRFFVPDHPRYDVFGLAYSREHRRHLQSFLLSFGARCFGSEVFTRWWSQMTPVNERNRVITQFELGLSSYLRRAGFKLGWAYHPTFREIFVALGRALRTPKRTLNPLSLSPTHFYWDFVLREFGIAKIELIKSNPYQLMDAGSRERLAQAGGAAGAE
jgi:rhamnosyltransferase